ncbi:MAG: hypothetical protein GY870_09175 [archaeon]|nr:hypothetical protein [archaeon]
MKDKKYMLNENIFRNTHYQVLNKLKQSFEPISTPEEYDIYCKKIIVSYRVEKKSKRSFDTGNIAFAVDKFFLDWLQNNYKIVNDAYNVVSYGSITGKNDCEYDRVIATIET